MSRGVKHYQEKNKKTMKDMVLFQKYQGRSKNEHGCEMREGGQPCWCLGNENLRHGNSNHRGPNTGRGTFSVFEKQSMARAH